MALSGGAISVGVGYGISRVTGSEYGKREAGLDVLLGATPIAAVGAGLRVLRTGYKFRRYIPAGVPTMQKLGPYTHKFGGMITPIATKPEFYAGVAITMAIQSKPIWQSVVRKSQVTTVVDYLDGRSTKEESPSQSLTSRRKGGTSSRSFSKQKRQLDRRDKSGDGPRDSRSRGKTYCKRHKQYDFCKKYNI